MQRAAAKAVGAAVPDPSAWVLGVDTVVELDGREYGKPTNRAAAEAALRALSGLEHHVYSAHCLWRARDGRQQTRLAAATVRFLPLSDARLDAYLATGAWRGKAGAYGIQDPAADFIELVEGDLDTVVGLSVRAVRQLLREAGES